MNKDKIFNISSIHQQYWKEFCDVCYSRFGFENGEERNYAQKYETFCRCKGYVTENSDYELELLHVYERDLQRLRMYSEWFFTIDDGKDIVPALYNFVRMLRTVGHNIEEDTLLIKYICPRKPKVNYSSYRLDDTKKIDRNIRNNSKLQEVDKSEIDYTILNEIIDEESHLHQDNVNGQLAAIDLSIVLQKFDDGDIVSLTNQIIELEISLFNYKFDNFIDTLPSGTECPRGNELQAFLYRLFMSFEDSLSDIKEELEELPPIINLNELQEVGKRLEREFFNTPLGERWAKCIVCDGGLKHFANYFMHHRKDFTEEDERRFFYTLDKICLIEDILHGKADKYWLEVEYPKGWYANNGDSEYVAHEKSKDFILEPDHKRKEAKPTIDDKVNSPYPFIIIPSLEDAIISKILSYLEGKTPSQAKDVMKPLRAAQDAGVIRRITYEEMKTVFPEYCPISKSSVSKYTKEDEMPYIDQAFKDMVVDFKAMKGN